MILTYYCIMFQARLSKLEQTVYKVSTRGTPAHVWANKHILSLMHYARLHNQTRHRGCCIIIYIYIIRFEHAHFVFGMLSAYINATPIALSIIKFDGSLLIECIYYYNVIVHFFQAAGHSFAIHSTSQLRQVQAFTSVYCVIF